MSDDIYGKENLDIFHQTDEEKQAKVDESFQRDKETWDLETTDYLLDEVGSGLRGCHEPYCLSCANTYALVAVLKERFLTLQKRR